MLPELSTERFYLRPILPEDQVFIFEGLSHPEVITHYGVSYQSFEAVREQMDFYQLIVKTGRGMWWKIVDKNGKDRAGAVGYNNYQTAHNKAEIGYWLLPPFQRKGIIHETLPVVMLYMQKEKNIHRIEAFVEEGNTGSCKVLQKLHFTHEGKMRDCEIKNGKYISLHIYSFLTTDALPSV
jgi:[ribosomal protein S5]-alanine N-acetyltransferase